MKKQQFILAAAFAVISSPAFSQARLTLSDGAFMVVSGGAKLVVDNPAPNAIQTIGTGGRIVSESDSSGVKWNIGTATGAYNFPFTTKPAVQGGDEVAIPLTVTITTPGSADGSLMVSTYKTSNTNQPYPAGVTNLYSSVQNGDGSLYAIDRFWIIDAQSWSTQPAAMLSIGYNDGAAETGGSNTFAEGTLKAQRWDDVNDTWGGGQFGTVNPATNSVDGIAVPSGGFHSVWTLVSSASPLPVTLIALGAENEGPRNKVEWSSATEDNLDSYGLEKSRDGAVFAPLQNVPARGRAYGYIAYDNEPVKGFTYYRLKMVEHDGRFTYSKTVKAYHQPAGGLVLEAFPNPATDVLNIRTYGADAGEAALYNAVGALVARTTVAGGQAALDVKALSAGTYMLRFTEAGKGTVQTVRLVKQ